MATLSDLTALRTRVDHLRTEVNKAVGAKDQLLKQLKSEFGCNSLKEGVQLLKKLQAEEAQAKQDFDKSLKEFEAKWGEALQ